MTDALDSTVPAGWYPDPWGSTSQRWWDGTSWSANLYPQPETMSPDAPAQVSLSPDGTAATDDEYVPVAVRSTYEPASSYRTAAAPTVGSPFPSRRTMRELAHSAAVEDVAEAPEGAPMAEPMPDRMPLAENPPAYTQAPEFSPEPEPALPAPVWIEFEATAHPAPPPAAAPEVAFPQAAEPEVNLPEAPVEVPALRAPVATPAAVPVPSASTRPTMDDDGWAASLSNWDDVETTSTPPDALPIFGDAPPVSYSQRAVRYQPLHGRTSPVWLIVFMPILQAVAVVGSLYLFPGFTQDQLVTLAPSAAAMLILLTMRDWMLFALAPITLVFLVFTLVLGFQDRSRLRFLGHDQTASPWWIVLSPLVYLIVRSVRVRQSTGRRGSGPLTTYICLYIAPVIAIIVASVVASAVTGAIGS